MENYMMREFFKDYANRSGDHEFMRKFKEFIEDDYNEPYSKHRSSEYPNNKYMTYSTEPSTKRGYFRREGYPQALMDMFMEESSRYNSENFLHKMRNMFEDMSNEEKEHFWKNLLGTHSESKGERFNESYAKYEVAKMYHIENGRKHVGEKFNIEKAKEIYEIYKGSIPHSVTTADVYVAINASYHDTIMLFKTWFGEDIDHKIIEFAINFWFRDSDAGEGKIWKYFKE